MVEAQLRADSQRASDHQKSWRGLVRTVVENTMLFNECGRGSVPHVLKMLVSRRA